MSHRYRKCAMPWRFSPLISFSSDCWLEHVYLFTCFKYLFFSFSLSLSLSLSLAIFLADICRGERVDGDSSRNSCHDSEETSTQETFNRRRPNRHGGTPSLPTFPTFTLGSSSVNLLIQTNTSNPSKKKKKKRKKENVCGCVYIYIHS